jgi:hypothetical protein
VRRAACGVWLQEEREARHVAVHEGVEAQLAAARQLLAGCDELVAANQRLTAENEELLRSWGPGWGLYHLRVMASIQTEILT